MKASNSSPSKFTSFLQKQRQIPFQHRVREQFINSKKLLKKKLSRSTGNLSTSAANDSGGSQSKSAIKAESKEKSKSLNEDHLLTTTPVSKKPASKQRQRVYNQNSPYRPQHTNKYRKLRTTPRIPAILGQFAEHQHDDRAEGGVVDHMVKWASNSQASSAQTDDFIGCRRCKYQEESDDDEGSDDIFVGDEENEEETCSSSSDKCSSLIINNSFVEQDDKTPTADQKNSPDINKIIDEVDDLDKQIMHEIELLDKTLEEYS